MTPKESATLSHFLWSADLLPNRCRPSPVNHKQMEILFCESVFFFQRDLNCKRSCCNLQPNTVRGSRWTFNQRSLPGDQRRCHSRWAGTTRVGTPGRQVQLCGTIIALLSLMSPPSICPSIRPSILSTDEDALTWQLSSQLDSSILPKQPPVRIKPNKGKSRKGAKIWIAWITWF